MIAGNLLGLLHHKLKGKQCQPFGSDFRLHVEKNTFFTYPDISVVCGDIVTLNDDDYNLLNPSLIFETTPFSIRSEERESKFTLYRDIPTLKEFISVDPDASRVEAFHINACGKWELREYKNLDETLLLPSIQISLPLRDIYERTKVAG